MNNNICKEYDATSIQQLTKIVTDKDTKNLIEKDIFPVAVLQAIYDALTGTRLDIILSSFNCIYVPYKGNRNVTRLAIINQMRRKGLIIVFKDLDNKIYTQRYIYDSIEDEYWENDANWENCFVSYDEEETIKYLTNYINDYIKENVKGVEVDNALSETSENPVQNKVITEQINNINKVLFPLNISVSGGGLFEKRSTQDITVSWDIKKGNNNIVPDTITVNDVNVNNTSKFKQFNSVTSNTTYTVKAIKDNVTVSGSVSAIFVNPSYFGAVSDSFIPTEDNIKELSKNVKNTKNYTGLISLDNNKLCYAYPKSFGALTSIKDSNGFDYMQSYVRTELTIWDESYWVYVLKDATTIDDFKQIYL